MSDQRCPDCEGILASGKPPGPCTHRPKAPPTPSEKLITAAREWAQDIPTIPGWNVAPLLIQLADALEESERGRMHKEALAASWRRKCEKARSEHYWGEDEDHR